jgi:hypothetical protein
LIYRSTATECFSSRVSNSVFGFILPPFGFVKALSYIELLFKGKKFKERKNFFSGCEGLQDKKTKGIVPMPDDWDNTLKTQVLLN